MSSDIQTLLALAKKTQHDMRYFELVVITNGTAVKRKRCFLAIGKHALFFLRQNLNHSIFDDADGGRIDYAYILNMVKDTTSRRHFMLVLGTNRPPDWTSERLYIESEHREALIRNLRNSWQTDYMWRLGKVAVLKMSLVKLRDVADGDEIEMKPFDGYQWQRFQDYKFLVPEFFESDEREGEWIYQGETSLIVQVHEPLTLDQLKTLGREHPRWVANEYIQNLVHDEDHFYITRNQQYTKRMNLVGDRAAWYAWEIIIQTKEVSFLAMLLRRQYLPPIFNTAQDIAVLLRCPREASKDYLPYWINSLRVISNSLCADASTFTIYQDIVQAKLDALRYDEEATFWIGAYLKLSPSWRREALIFLRRIIKMYIDDNAISDKQDILNAPTKDVLISVCEGDEWASIDDTRSCDQIIKDMERQGEGIPEEIEYKENPSDAYDASHTAESKADLEHNDKVKVMRSKWLARVARYFAWAVDGGLVGDAFTLDTMIEYMGFLTEESKKQANHALLFMLHIRERDMLYQWMPTSLQIWLRKPETGEKIFSNRLPYDRPDLLRRATFNENVMQALFRMDYIRRIQDEPYKIMGKFLDQDVGTQLKAFICRKLCEAQDETKQVPVEVIQPLMNLVKDGNTFLATYACAALVNLSHDNENVKNLLIGNAAHRELMPGLRSKDDDLLTYILMLMVNLTKEPHTRAIIAEAGLLPTLYDVLTSTYRQCGEKFATEVSASSCARKEKLLTQVCIVI